MTDIRRLNPETFLQHAGLAKFDDAEGVAPVALPPVRTSTVRFRDVEALEHAIERKAKGERAPSYGRMGMETHAALEHMLCQLEGGERAWLVSSGMAAITLGLLSVLSAGDHVLVADNVYGSLRRLERTVLQRFGIEVTYCSAQVAALEAQLQDNTRALYVESPGSLLMEMLDLPRLSEFARAHDLYMLADNTWGASYIYHPLALGADVSIVAGTKYLGGHSDLMLGAVISSDAGLSKQIDATHYAMGYSVSADDVWLALRGSRTLALRLRQTAATALSVAHWLQAQPLVGRVFHPALPTDAGHALWQRDATGSNGLLSFELLADPAAARRFVNSLRLFGIGFSWGGFESLVQWVDPQFVAEHRYWEGSSHPLLRLYVGLEAADDLIADLDRAMGAAQS